MGERALIDERIWLVRFIVAFGSRVINIPGDSFRQRPLRALMDACFHPMHRWDFSLSEDRNAVCRISEMIADFQID